MNANEMLRKLLEVEKKIWILAGTNTLAQDALDELDPVLEVLWEWAGDEVLGAGYGRK